MVETLDQVLLRIEVVVGVSHRDARLCGDGGHRRAVVPALVEQAEGSLDDARSGLLALRWLVISAQRGVGVYHVTSRLPSARRAGAQALCACGGRRVRVALVHP